MTTNEAAERLHAEFTSRMYIQLLHDRLDEALAAERRATVERIRAEARKHEGHNPGLYVDAHGNIFCWARTHGGEHVAILDEEAAR